MTPALARACDEAVQIVCPDGTVLSAGYGSLYVLRAVGCYMAFYLAVTHANKTATGEWQYPILADLTALGGAALRNVFFSALVGVNVAFGFLAKRILCAHEKKRA